MRLYDRLAWVTKQIGFVDLNCEYNHRLSRDFTSRAGTFQGSTVLRHTLTNPQVTPRKKRRGVFGVKVRPIKAQPYIGRVITWQVLPTNRLRDIAGEGPLFFPTKSAALAFIAKAA